jgi:hypothetical protein
MATTEPRSEPSFQAVEPSVLSWLKRNRRVTAPLVILVVVGGFVALDWPHTASQPQLRSDFEAFAVQVRGDVQSCALEVEQTLSAYNQITAGVVNDRNTAIGLASQTALDCTPMGNSRVDELGTLQPPRSLAKYNLDVATTSFYAWCFPSAVDVAQDIQKLLSKPGNPAVLADVKLKLAQLSTLAAVAQHGFDAAANDLAMGSTVSFGLDGVRPGVLVG